MPIAGFATVMGERKDSNRVRHLQIRNVIGEAADGRFAGGYIGGNAGNRRCGLRPVADSLQGRINRREELLTEP
jgi:hypothetical protein